MTLSVERLATLVVAGTVILGAACTVAEGDEESGSQEPAADARPLTRVVNVETTPVTITSFTDFIRITGEAEAFLDVTLSAEESGVIDAFVVGKGQRVRKQTIIARIDSRVLEAQVAEARASAALAGEQFERQRRLWEDEKIGSEITYLQTKYQAEIADARLATLEARLAKTEIRSPVNGVFDEKFVEIGELVLPGAAVARVVSVDRIKITGGVPERYASAIAAGDGARITFDILPDRTFDGTIGFVGSSVDESSRTFPVEVIIDNPGGVVKPRMVANVRLVRNALEDVIVVPQPVVQRSEDGYYVFIAIEQDGDTVAARRSVRLGPSSGETVVVTEGLDLGDHLIVVGAQLVDAGSRIRIVNASERVGGESAP